VTLVRLEDPPVRFAAGVDAVQTFEDKANTLLAGGSGVRRPLDEADRSTTDP
jgi:hypothetical protein